MDNADQRRKFKALEQGMGRGRPGKWAIMQGTGIGRGRGKWLMDCQSCVTSFSPIDVGSAGRPSECPSPSSTPSPEADPPGDDDHRDFSPEMCSYCSRPAGTIVCRACGHCFPGRVRSTCSAHAAVIHLMDFEACPQCKAFQLKEFSVKRTPEGGDARSQLQPRSLYK